MNVCMFCGNGEKGKVINNPFVCSNCVQVFIQATPEHLKRAYDKAVRLNKTDAINFLSNYVEVEDGEVIDSNMDRKRTNRKARPSYHKNR